MPPDRSFRRIFFVIALLHVVAVGVLYLLGTFQRKPPAEQVMWLEDGSVGGGETGAGEATPEQPPAPPTPAEYKTEPPPPEPKPELVSPPPPVVKQAPSELVTPQATPEPATPKPATPKPSTPKPATPRPETPKPETPRPHTPKPHTPHPTPKHTPKPTTPKEKEKEREKEKEKEEGAEDATPKPKPKTTPSEKPKGSPGPAKSEGTSTAMNKTSGATGGNGAGSGNGKGPGKTGNGSGTSEFGWYFSMIHDRFHSRWDQPTTLARGGQDIVTTLKIRISKDGAIQSREIVHSSGDNTMDQSVMTAAERVLEIDPLPAGLGNGEFFEINIAFKLDQGE